MHDKPMTLPSAQSPSRGLAWWMLGIIALLAGLVYANSTRNGYAFDDVAIVQNNVHVVNLEWSAIWTDGYWPKKHEFPPDALYRPLTIWSYLANQYFTPDKPAAFHVVNVALHALVSVLVALLAWRLIGDRAAAALTGILFAVHPLHTEAVSNIVGRAELLATLWALLTLLIYLPATPLVRNVELKTRSWWHGVLVAAAFFAAMLCKETPVTLLVAVVVIDAWIWARTQPPARPAAWRWFLSRGARYYLPMTLALGVYLALRIQACGLMSPVKMTSVIVNPLVDATLAERLVTPFLLLAKYLALTFWPVHLSADYSFPSLLPTSNLMAPMALAGILTCALTLIISVRAWRRAPQIILIVAMFFLAYALIANVIRIGTIFGERLFYAPSVFVLMLIAWAAVRVYAAAQGALAAHDARISKLQFRIAAWTLRGSALAVLAVLVLAMGWRSRVRNTDWYDNESLAISTARDNPQSGKACAWAGNVLVTLHNPAYEPFELELFQRAVDLSPGYAEARWAIASYYATKNDLPRSLIYLAQAVRLEPGDHYTRIAMTAAVVDLQKSEPEKYMPVLEAYQKEHPDDESIYLALAMAYHAQKKYDEAEANAAKALVTARRPQGYVEFHEAGAELATIRFERGLQAQGVDEFRIYVKNLRHSVDARCDFANMLISGDAKAHPEFLVEAQYNLDRADVIEPGNARVRQLRGDLTRARKPGGNAIFTADAVPAGPDLPTADTPAPTPKVAP